MKNWATLEADRVRLMGKHYTPGRGGQKIQHVTIHHMAMVGGIDECVRVWEDRPASAHYCVGPDGEIGQAVWDRDTAWSNANQLSNQRSITIEHSNSAGAAQDWPISEATLEEGAHLVAAICVYYRLGRPVSGKNVRFHNVESGGITSCPYHLRPGGKYHDRYMRRAQHWYDEMTKPKVAPKAKAKAEIKATTATTTTTSKKETPLMVLTDKEQKELLALARDIKAQLTGSSELGQYPGWAQLGGRTLIDGVAFVGKKLQVEGFKDVKKEAKGD